MLLMHYGCGQGCHPSLVPLGPGRCYQPSHNYSNFLKKEDDQTTKSLIEGINVFVWGSKANADWTPFWARLSSILGYPKYTPGGDITFIMTTANLQNK